MHLAAIDIGGDERRMVRHIRHELGDDARRIARAGYARPLEAELDGTLTVAARRAGGQGPTVYCPRSVKSRRAAPLHYRQGRQRQRAYPQEPLVIDSCLGSRIVAALAFTAAVLACAPATFAADPPAFDGGRALEHVRAVVGFGPRPPGSAAAADTRRYITAQMAAIGVQVAEQAFEAKTPIGAVKMVNVRATIPGARPERIILAGHYDTKLFRQFRFVGANDAGSSTAFLIEMARVLKARKNPFTIELLFIDGEEAFIDWYLGDDHTYGSRHYVQEAKRTGDLARIKAMILVDMIGDRDLVVKRETASTAWLTDAIWSAAKALGHSSTFVAESFAVEDDHVPFLNAGVPAVDIIDLEYAPWHTAEDTLDKVSARSMEVVGRVLTAALPKIESRLLGTAGR